MTSLLAVEEPFKIFVGDSTPTKVHVGYIDMGKSTLKSGTSLIDIDYNGGDEIFPNFWEGWGRRVIKGKPNEDGTSVEVTDKDYKGEVEFLEFGNPNGGMIYCRWVDGCSSLDYQYQITRLSIVTKELDEKNLLLTLERGEHKIDPVKGAAYALAIKVHPMNQNSKFKTQRYSNYLYKETNVYDTKIKAVKEIDEEWEAIKIIKERQDSFANLMVLYEIFCSDGKQIRYNKEDENSLNEALLLYAKESPSEVLRLIQKRKEEVSNLIAKGQSYEMFDTTKNGVIMVGGVKKEKVFDEVPCKGDDMLQWVFENLLDPKVHEKIKRVEKISEKIFK